MEAFGCPAGVPGFFLCLFLILFLFLVVTVFVCLCLFCFYFSLSLSLCLSFSFPFSVSFSFSCSFSFCFSFSCCSSFSEELLENRAHCAQVRRIVKKHLITCRWYRLIFLKGSCLTNKMLMNIWG